MTCRSGNNWQLCTSLSLRTHKHFLNISLNSVKQRCWDSIILQLKSHLKKNHFNNLSHAAYLGSFSSWCSGREVLPDHVTWRPESLVLVCLFTGLSLNYGTWSFGFLLMQRPSSDVLEEKALKPCILQNQQGFVESLKSREVMVTNSLSCSKNFLCAWLSAYHTDGLLSKVFIFLFQKSFQNGDQEVCRALWLEAPLGALRM